MYGSEGVIYVTEYTKSCFFRNYSGASTRTNAETSLKSTLCLFLIQDGRHHGNDIFQKTKGTLHALHHFYNLKIIYCVFTQDLRYEKE